MITDLVRMLAAAWWQAPRNSLDRSSITVWALQHAGPAAWRHALATAAPESSDG